MKTPLIPSLLALALALAFATDPHAQSRGGRDEALARLAAATNNGGDVSFHDGTGTARYVRLRDSGRLNARPADTDALKQRDAIAFLSAYAPLFGIADAATQLGAARASRDALGHTRLVQRQVHQGVPVFAAELKSHFDAAGQLTSVGGNFVPDIDVPVTPTRSAAEAAATAVARVQASRAPRVEALNASAPQLMVYNAGLLKSAPGANHLVWYTTVGNGRDVREFLMVDAHTGKVVEQITGIHDDKHRRAFDAAGATAPGPNYPNNPYWVEGNAFPTASSDANSLLRASSEIYDLFRLAFGRDSYDGAGAAMNGVFNRGNRCPNASWNGQFASFCPGLATDDVTAHEWSHAYTEYMDGLIYQWQPGALNESFADIWGETVDRLNGRDDIALDAPRTPGVCSVTTPGGSAPSVRWLVGEDVNGSGMVGALRDMYNPTCYGHPGKVSDPQYTCDPFNLDSGGVHTNSGVPNHAFALLVDGGTYNGQTIAPIGLTKAAHIYFRAQSVYQGPASDFPAHAYAIEQSCKDLTGKTLLDLKTGAVSTAVISRSDCAQVAKATLAVELRQAPKTCGFTTNLAQNPPPLCAQGKPASIFSEGFDAADRLADGTWRVSTEAKVAGATPVTWQRASTLQLGLPGSAMKTSSNDPYGDLCPTTTDSSAVTRLESPEIKVPANLTNLRMAFDHSIQLEPNYDGGILMISVNGGAWTVVKREDFVFNPYNGTLDSTNPLGVQPAFTGVEGGRLTGTWGRSIINLAPYARSGDRVRLRFEMGQDRCLSSAGWYVDNVNVYVCRP